MPVARSLVLTVLASACLLDISTAAAEGDLHGMWQPQRYVASLRTVDGKLPPLLPAAAQLYKSRVDARKAKGPTGDPLEQCLPAGTPRSMYQTRPFLLVQTPHKVTLVHEFQHLVRHVYLDEAVAFDDTTWLGSSAGHWDGDTLVIETSGFNGNTWLDEAGLPLSEQLKVTERLTASGKSKMLAEVTIEDPENYSAPWKTALTFERVPNGDLGWHVCTEKLYPMPKDARPGPPA
jgi:hypothetical protein